MTFRAACRRYRLLPPLRSIVKSANDQFVIDDGVLQDDKGSGLWNLAPIGPVQVLENCYLGSRPDPIVLSLGTAVLRCARSLILLREIVSSSGRAFRQARLLCSVHAKSLRVGS